MPCAEIVVETVKEVLAPDSELDKYNEQSEGMRELPTMVRKGSLVCCNPNGALHTSSSSQSSCWEIVMDKGKFDRLLKQMFVTLWKSRGVCCCRSGAV